MFVSGQSTWKIREIITEKFNYIFVGQIDIVKIVGT